MLAALLPLVSTGACAQQSYEAQRNALVGQIQQNARETAQYTGKARLERSVMAAIATVPRHEFVPEGVRDLAYTNRPLPIGEAKVKPFRSRTS